MKKEQLRKLRRLYATDTMMKNAGMDVPIKKTISWRNARVNTYKHGLYMRCQVLSGILKVAFFATESMRLGSNKPLYELFINKNSGEFITWDVLQEKWSNAKLDMLDWPDTVRYSPDKFINREGNRSIKTYLGVANGGYRGILDYQLSVREDQLKQRYRRETDPWDMKMEQIPELPKDWKQWFDKTGIPENYIFYEYSRKGATEGYCSWCEKTVPISKPKHNTDGKCSCCGHSVKFKSTGKAGNFSTKRVPVYLLQRCEDGFVIREFMAHRHYYKGKYEKPDKCCFEQRRVIYDKNMNAEAFWYGLYKQMHTRWIKSGYYSCYGSESGRVYKRTIPTLSKNELKRTGLPEMINSLDKIDPELYLYTLKNYGYLEQLAKAGLTRLANEIVTGGKNINIKHISNLAKALNIDKQRLKRLRENNGGRIFLEWMKFEKRNEKNISDDIIQYFESENIMPDNLKFISKRMSETKIYNFLRKQYALSGRKPKELLSSWDDYLCMANRLKMDTKIELVYKPRNLIKSHDKFVKLCGGQEIAKRAGEIAEKFPNVDEICLSVKEKYEFSDEKYAILAPSKIEDIITEGQILGHCLDGSDRYFERIQIRESYIVFLRKKEELDRPYYTLEIEPGGAVRQKRTVGDKQNPDFQEARKFIEKWQKEIQKRLSDEDMKLSHESAKLRIEEFAELRRTKAKIWRGHLAGHLLADVLEADFMEVPLEREGA
ncbi:PcfJ domain-containing protein [Anaerocolumna sp. AGMB13020]|uniref:PcfJ domain-containing protein n=1 Tax=Anaerocolumna sp. AGMB13020 TaxID=3081750 RepID=UPI0029556F34|nr:PcfJ domain-containing protein [Anaerocolumna sp. AGMB13020]WOO34924.1 PcfJ domain-containing protein [Anaerocolumna sp. AGMB13020]